MAERRMFTKKIIDSDAFLDMPLSTQSLYFHLNMRADDDGFLNNPKKIQRMIGASEDDLKLLIAKRFVLAFETGVIVIKHWRMHNLLRKDRYSPTQYADEMERLVIKDNGSYTEKPVEIPMATTWQPNGNQTGNHLATQDSIGKDSIGKVSIENDILYDFSDSDEPKKPPKPIKHKYGEYKNVLLTDSELEKIQEEYPDWKDRIERLSSYVASTGKKYKSHYATIRNWARKDAENPKIQKVASKNKFNNFQQRDYDFEAYERMLLNEKNPPPTAGENPEIQEKVEELKKRLGVV